MLLSNRSAVYLKQNKVSEALEDAERACLQAPKCVKVYVRKALALIKMKKFKEARHVNLEASKIEPDNMFLKRMLQSIESKLPVDSFTTFMNRYKNTNDIRIRLATLATFWNESNKDERFEFLRHLNSLIRAKEPDSVEINNIMQQFTKNHMVDLPMKNYAGVSLPEDWVPWYNTTSKPEKIQLVNALWNSCSSTERNFIAKDIYILFKTKQ